jgi:hypothetical protein
MILKLAKLLKKDSFLMQMPFSLEGVRGQVPFAQGDWRAELLSQIALRCGAKPTTVTGALCSSVGLAAIDSLGLIGDEEAYGHLDQLLSEITNAGMVRKVAKIVGAPEERLLQELMRLRSQRRPTIDRPWLGRWR